MNVMKIKCFKNVSAKCTAAVMAASMVLTPVAGALAFPMGIYAVDYQTTSDITPDTETGKIYLTSADTLALNDGTIDINEGAIAVNEGTVNVNSGTVADNASEGVIKDNYGTVGDGSSGTVTINHESGKVDGGTVTDNYGKADECQVTNNYQSGTVTGDDSNVVNNWGTVTDVSSVTNNCGIVNDNIDDGVLTEVTNNYLGGKKVITATGEDPITESGTIDGASPTPETGKATDPQRTAPKIPAKQTTPAKQETDQEQHQAANDTSRSAAFDAVYASATDLAAGGLALTPEQQALVATTPEQALLLAQTAVPDPVALSGGAALVTDSCDPATITLAKAEVLFDPAVINSLKNLRIGSQYGVPNVTGAGMIAASDGRAIKSQTVNIECPGLTSAKGVAVLVYTLNSDGTKSAKVVKPRFSKGKLKVQLPVPCEYVIVQNVSVQ